MASPQASLGLPRATKQSQEGMKRGTWKRVQKTTKSHLRIWGPKIRQNQSQNPPKTEFIFGTLRKVFCWGYLGRFIAENSNFAWDVLQFWPLHLKATRRETLEKVPEKDPENRARNLTFSIIKRVQILAIKTMKKATPGSDPLCSLRSRKQDLQL